MTSFKAAKTKVLVVSGLNSYGQQLNDEFDSNLFCYVKKIMSSTFYCNFDGGKFKAEKQKFLFVFYCFVMSFNL